MEGILQVRVGEQAGKTRVVESFASAPFHYLPEIPASDGSARVTIVSSSGGVFGGDRLSIRVSVGARAHLRLCTQSATRVYRSEADEARCRFRLRVGRGATLESIPDEIIPFADSDYVQETDLFLDAGASAIVAEVVTAGRLSCDERFAFRRLRTDLRCRLADGRRLHESVDLEPASRPLGSSVVLGESSAWASFYALSEDHPNPDLVEAVDRVMGRVAGGCGGASVGPVGIVGRAVAAEAEELHRAIAGARDLVRAAWSHATAPDPPEEAHPDGKENAA